MSGTNNNLPDGVLPVLGQHSQEESRPNDTSDEHTGPLKAAIYANKDSLYKYISWEDPVRTLGSYIGALSILFGVHYLPITQLALKYGASLLGVVTATELIHGTFTSNTLLKRLRPTEYKRIPESTLNDTLRDIHDFAQYAVVKAQRILFCQDWEHTLIAFFGLTALFWLNKLVSPFGLAIIGLTSIYIAPLVNSPRGREVAHDAAVRADELRTAAVNNTQKLAQDGKAKVADLSSQAQVTAQNAQQRAGEMAQNAQQRASELAQSGKQAAVDLSNQARGNAVQASNVVADKTSNASSAVADKTANASNAAVNSAKGIPASANNAFNQAYDSFSATTDRTTSTNPYRDNNSATGSISNTASHAADTAKQYLPQSVTNAANDSAARVSDFANSTTQNGRQPGSSQYEDPTYTLERTAERVRDTSSQVPRQNPQDQLAGVTGAVDNYESSNTSVLDRPRGALADTNFQ